MILIHMDRYLSNYTRRPTNLFSLDIYLQLSVCLLNSCPCIYFCIHPIYRSFQDIVRKFDVLTYIGPGTYDIRNGWN